MKKNPRLLTADSGVEVLRGSGTVVTPATLGSRFEKRGRGINRKRVCCDLEHGEVVNGVAEDGVGTGEADTLEGDGFAFVGGDVDDLAFDDAVFNANFGGKDADVRDAEFAYTFRDDPFVGGTDGPKLDASVLEGGEEGRNFREDAGLDDVCHVSGGGGAEFGLVEAGVDLDHLAADLQLRDLAGEVGAVTGVDPVSGGARDEALLDGPFHESVAGVAAPDGAVAIEDGHAWAALKDLAFEFCGGPFVNLHLCRCHTFLDEGQ